MVPLTSAPWRAMAVACLAVLSSLAASASVQAVDATADQDTSAPLPWISTELDGEVRDLASGVVPFVAVGTTGFPPQAAAWSSDDGRTWTPGTVVDAPAGSTMWAVVPTGTGFAALGHEWTADGADADRMLAWYSADGLTWEPASMKRPAKSKLQAVATALANGPAGQLALGSYIGQDLAGQRLWQSADGQTWAPVALPGKEGAIYHTLVSTPDGYLLLGQSPRGTAYHWRSPDGTTWKRLKDAPMLFDLATSPDGLAVGLGSKAIWTSTDLRTWAKAWTRPKAWSLGDSNAFEWVDWDGSAFLVAGDDFGSCPPDTDECHRNPLLVSTDGQAWSEADGPDGEPGADAGTWLEGSAASDGSVVLAGQATGVDTVWLVDGGLTAPTGAD